MKGFTLVQLVHYGHTFQQRIWNGQEYLECTLIISLFEYNKFNNQFVKIVGDNELFLNMWEPITWELVKI